MNSTNVLTKIPKLSGASDVHSQNIDFDEKNWNCLTSKEFLACYFKHFKEEEENRDGSIRSKSKEKKELKCSIKDYQQLIPVLTENTSYEKLCKCFNCLQIYHKQNVEFLFFIKNIECLPTEMLLMIFKHLTPSDRRIASECCKRFLDIWLCDAFMDDRRLVFDCCVLDPEREPLSVFLKSERIYRHLAFGDVIMRGEPVFAEKLGENVTTVELISMDSDEYVNEIRPLLLKFPNIKIIKKSGVFPFMDILQAPTTIELLVISDFDWSHDDELDMLKPYLERTSDSLRVELNGNFSTEDILTFTESEQNKIQRVNLLLSEVDDSFQLPRFNNLLYLGLDFECGTENVLGNLEEQCPALKDLSIKIHKRLPHKNWPFLKTLKAWDVPKEEMSRINIFENLKELKLGTIREDCFFFHKAFLNKTLKKLTINTTRNDPCFTCFQKLTKSFPNLESLSCIFLVTNDHLEELAINTPKLKSLNLDRVDPLLSFAGLINLTELSVNIALTPHIIETWPMMFQLRQITFHLPHLNFKVANIFERMSALEDLDIICGSIDGDQLALLEALTKPLKRLKKIQFYCERIQPELIPEIIDAMVNNCKYLQRIEINESASQEILKQILEKHSSIRCINAVWLE